MSLRRASVACACALALAWAPRLASAQRPRVQWRGFSVSGPSPPHLDRAVEAEVQVALRALGADLSRAEGAVADCAASCAIAAGGRAAECSVEVARTGGRRAERRAHVPFHDADDLARSVALLLADTLQLELPDVLGGGMEPGGEPPPELAEPPVAPPRPPRLTRPRPLAVVRPRPPPMPPAKWSLDVVGSVALGVSGEPPLYGAEVRATWAPEPLRVGGSAHFAGATGRVSSYDVSFFRLVLGPRVGAGWQSGRLDVDVTLGPALFLLATSAQPGGSHVLATGAALFGGRAAVALTRRVALVALIDAVIAVTEQRLDAGPATVLVIGRVTVDLGLGVTWRN